MKQKVLHKLQYQLYAKCMLMLLLSFLLSGWVFAQERSVNGTITDESGIPLPGVNTIIKGTTTGVVSDLNGKFSIKVPNDDAVLLVTYVGYQSQEIKVGTQMTFTIALKEEVKQLNEVVVIGYGVQKKSDLTGSVASVKSEDIAKVPVTGIAAALQGRATGVQVSQETGAPGSNVSIRIRGISTITQANGVFQGGPLWVIDGVPGGNVNTVNTDDIESVEILKDGASAAIYGASGGSGVILVTTKRGKAGKPEVDVNYYHGFQYVPKRLNMATGVEYVTTYTEKEAIQGFHTFTYVNNPALPYKNLKDFPTYNYQDMVFQTPALMDNLNFSVSGGTEKSKAFLGVGYINQDGIFKTSGFQKFNFRINSDYTVNDWFKFGETMGFDQQTTSGFEDWQYQNEYQSPLMGALQVLPWVAPYDSTGNFVPKQYGQAGDPMVGIGLLHKSKKLYEGQGTFFTIIEPLKGLGIESRLTGGLNYHNDYQFYPTYHFGPGAGESNTLSQIYRYMQQNFNYNWQNLIRYNATFLNDFNLAALLGYEVGGSEGNDISGTRNNLLSEKPEMWYFNASQDITTAGVQLVSGGGYKNTGYSYLGRLSLDYKEIILLQGNFRRDYSSKFGPDRRYGNFPGYSVGLKFSEFDFVKNNLPILSFGKVRYAMGNNGNNAIRDYAYYSTVAVLQHWQYPFGNSTAETVGAGPNVLANQEVHWEDIRNQNIGVDLNFIENKLSITVDKFDRHNIGMLVPQTLPGYAGWTVRDSYQESLGVDPRPIVNIGKMTNKGWELSLSWKDAIGKFKYSFDAGYTYVKSEATDLGSDSVRLGGGAMGLATAITRTVTGGEIGSFYGFKVQRIFQVSDTGTFYNGKLGIVNQPYTLSGTNKIYAQQKALPGDFQFVDINHDGKIDTKDMTDIGNPNPRHLFSLNMYFEYGWFDLSLFWQGTAGNKIFNDTKFSGVVSSGDYNWSEDYVKNHYRANEIIATDATGNVVADFPANTNAKYPRIDPKDGNQNFSRVSDFYVEDGSYLRLKNIQLGMTLPKAWTSKIAISEFKIYVGAKNALTFTKYTGMDPEVPMTDPLNSGIDKAAYPQARSVIFGANVRF